MEKITKCKVIFPLYNSKDLYEVNFNGELIFATPDIKKINPTQQWRRKWRINSTHIYYWEIRITINKNDDGEVITKSFLKLKTKQNTKMPFQDWNKIFHFCSFIEKEIKKIDAMQIYENVIKRKIKKLEFYYDPNVKQYNITKNQYDILINNIDNNMSEKSLSKIFEKSINIKVNKVIEKLSHYIDKENINESILSKLIADNNDVFSLILPITYNAKIQFIEKNIETKELKLKNRVDFVANDENYMPILIEIKRIDMKLMESNTTRNNVFAPALDLVNACQQINFYSRIYIASVNTIKQTLLKRILIAGKRSNLISEIQKNNFEDFRYNQKNLIIFTWDEILIKLKEIIK